MITEMYEAEMWWFWLAVRLAFLGYVIYLSQRMGEIDGAKE